MSDLGHKISHNGPVTLEQVKELPDFQRAMFSLEIISPTDLPALLVAQFTIQTLSFALNRKQKTFSIYQIITINQDMLNYPEQMFAENSDYVTMRLRLFANTGETKETIDLVLNYTGSELIMNGQYAPAVHYITFDVVKLTIF
jgi:hypothetical protein